MKSCFRRFLGEPVSSDSLQLCPLHPVQPAYSVKRIWLAQALRRDPICTKMSYRGLDRIDVIFYR